MTGKKRPGGSEDVSQGQIRGKGIPGRGQWTCKCPGVGCACGGIVRRPLGDGGRQVMEARPCRASQGTGKPLAFTLSEKGALGRRGNGDKGGTQDLSSCWVDRREKHDRDGVRQQRHLGGKMWAALTLRALDASLASPTSGPGMKGHLDLHRPPHSRKDLVSRHWGRCW